MGRAPCCDKANVKRGPWSPDEDATLKAYIDTHGTGGNWMALPVKAGLRRCGKSCRLRWLNYLRPNIKHGGFTEEDDNIILTLHSQIGSRWSVIASRLPGRTDNDVKNYWNTKLKKKLGNILSFDTTKSDKLEHVGSKPKSLPCISEAEEIHSFVNVSASQNQNPSSFGLSAYNFHSLSSDPIQTYCPGLHMDVSEFSTSASTSRNSSSTRSNIVSILSDQESSGNISNSSATFGLDRSVSLAGNYDQLVYGSGVLMDFTGFGSSPYNSNNPDNYRICFQDKDGEVYPTPCYQNMGDFAFADIRPAQAHVLEPSVRDKY